MRYAAVDRIVHRVKPRSGGGFGRDQVQIGHAARKIAPKGRWHNYPLEFAFISFLNVTRHRGAEANDVAVGVDNNGFVLSPLSVLPARVALSTARPARSRARFKARGECLPRVRESSRAITRKPSAIMPVRRSAPGDGLRCPNSSRRCSRRTYLRGARRRPVEHHRRVKTGFERGHHRLRVREDRHLQLMDVR